MKRLSPRLVGNKLKNFRLSVNETQEEFAEHIDRTVETVSNIERGNVLPSLETVANIFEYFGTNSEIKVLREEDIYVKGK